MPQGRIILKSISQSRKLAMLKTDGARLLYTWLIPNLDIQGCFSGDADVIRGQIFTRLKKSINAVEGYLQDLEVNKLVLRYECDGDMFLCIPDFSDKQPSLNPAKEAKSRLPQPAPELLQSYSGATPPKAKEECKEETKEETKGDGAKKFILSVEYDRKITAVFGELLPNEKVTFRNIRLYLGTLDLEAMQTAIKWIGTVKIWGDDHDKDSIEVKKCYVSKIKKLGWKP